MGLRALLPELPTAFSAKVPRQSVNVRTSTKASAMRQSDDLATTVIGGETQERTEREEDAQFEAWFSGRGSQIDPVRCLQGIFPKQEHERRKPGVNRIAEKYKKLHRSAQGRGGSRMTATAGFSEFAAPSFSGMRDSFPASPATAANFFSDQGLRMSQPEKLGRGGAAVRTGTAGNPILLQHDNSSRAAFVPPQTAPLVRNRPDRRH